MTTLDVYTNFKDTLWNGDNSKEYVVCSCAKNENDYIIEWINHYINLGFTKIIIIDNNTDNSLESLLHDYIDTGKLIIVKAQNMTLYQIEFYSYFCSDSNFKWCAFFDVDEFLEISTVTIQDLVNYIDEDVLCFHWMLYNSCGILRKEEGLVQTRFKMPVFPLSMTKENMFIKSIVKGNQPEKFKNCKFNGSHVPYTERGLTYNIGGTRFEQTIHHTNYPIRYKYGYLKHYYTKSFEEWQRKSQRGWPDGTINLNLDYYFVLNSVNIPIENYTKSLFCDNTVNEQNEILKKFDVIEIRMTESPFAFLRGVSIMMSQTTNHTFIITNNIDDTLYTTCLENAIKTGNRLIYCRNNEEVWQAFLKYNDGRNYTYFIITLY